MRFFEKAPDGGANSGSTGYFLVEIKWLFSIVLLRFTARTREAFHEHAFNALTVWLKGSVLERTVCVTPGDDTFTAYVDFKTFSAGNVKYTPRGQCHQIAPLTQTAWAISFRGPWLDTWREWVGGGWRTLTHG